MDVIRTYYCYETETVFWRLLYVTEKGLALSKQIGSDSAAVMTDKVSGVATRLHQSNPCIVAIHCVAHCLALACSQAGEKLSMYRNSRKH